MFGLLALGFCQKLGIIFIIFFTAILYLITFHHWFYFNNRNIKFNRGIPILGSFYKGIVFFIPFFKSAIEVYDMYPNESIIGIYYVGGKPAYMVRDPKLFRELATNLINREIFCKSDPLFGRSVQFMRGEPWKKVRALLNPGFTRINMKSMMNLMLEPSKRFCKSLAGNMVNDVVVCNVQPLFSAIANDILAKCIFGVNVDTSIDNKNEFFKRATSVSTIDLGKGFKLMMYSMAARLMNFFKVNVVSAKDMKYFRDIVTEQIEYRQKNAVSDTNFLELLIQSLKEISKNGNSMKNWTMDDYVAQCVAYLFGGKGQISLTLSFASYELAVNQDIQEKLQNEIDSVHRKLNGNQLTYNDLNGMQYLDMVLNESLRRWTQIGIVDRSVHKPMTIQTANGQTIDLKPGDSIMYTTCAVHNDPKYFPNPEKFDPERFNSKNRATINNAFQPFGAGLRICIAYKFALIVIKVIFYNLLLNYKIEKSPSTDYPFKLKRKSVFPDAENGFWLKIKKRNNLENTL